MFTQKCFIRKNTEEIRGKLCDIGYKTKERVDFEGIKINEQDQLGMYRTVYASCVKVGIPEKYGFIDCGINEELFLAIAALRDDSDIHQWFTNDVFWIKCSQLELKNELDNNYEEFCVADFHKATVEELIEHFKNKL